MKLFSTTRFRCRVCALVLALLPVWMCFQACRPPSSDGAEDVGDPVAIVQEGQSDYVLIYSGSDAIAKTIATGLSDLLYSRFGVSLKTRSDDSSFEHEILIGDVNRQESKDAAAKLAEEDDFYIGYHNGKLVLYAKTLIGAKKLVILLRDRYCIENSEKTFLVGERESYLASAHPDASIGASISILQNGETDYAIIYNNSDIDDERVARHLQKLLLQQTGVEFPLYRDFDRYESTGHEILVGCNLPDREESRAANKSFRDNDNFYITVVGEKLILKASNENKLLIGAEYFAGMIAEKMTAGNCVLEEYEEYDYVLAGKTWSLEQDRLCYLYETVLRREPTLYEFYYRKGTISSTAKNDQALIESLIGRMGESAAFCVGSSSALWKGYVHKLDPENYSRNAVANETSVLVPAPFANAFFGLNLPAGNLVDLKVQAQASGMQYYFDAETGLAIVSPADCVSFEADAEKGGTSYTNLAFRNRMLRFFAAEEMPEPKNNTEQTRVVIDTQYHYPEDALDFTQPTYTVCYSPSILNLTENGSSVLYASYELCNIRNGEELSTATVIQTSTDGGATWTEKVRLNDLRWAELFQVDHTVYIIGSGLGSAGIRLYRLEEDRSYTEVKLFSSSSGIMQVLTADGFLYVPLDNGLASVSLSDDLMKPSNWTLTNDPNDLVGKQWFTRITGKNTNQIGYCNLVEGNAVKGPDGAIYAIYRIESHPNANYAVMLKLSADRKSLSLLENDGSLISMPTSISRFIIQYDETSGQYILISNLWTVTSTDTTTRARNVVGISVSSDLRTWKTVDILLVDREMINPECSCWCHAFQYPDWAFDGDDIVLVIREATGFTNTFHDGKYMTFYRVKNFRSLIAQD